MLMNCKDAKPPFLTSWKVKLQFWQNRIIWRILISGIIF